MPRYLYERITKPRSSLFIPTRISSSMDQPIQEEQLNLTNMERIALEYILDGNCCIIHGRYGETSRSVQQSIIDTISDTGKALITRLAKILWEQVEGNEDTAVIFSTYTTITVSYHLERSYCDICSNSGSQHNI